MAYKKLPRSCHCRELVDGENEYVNMSNPTVKTCKRCGETKSVEEFGLLTRAKDGLSPRCKLCACDVNKIWRSENKEQHAAMSKTWNDRNPGAHALINKTWYQLNPGHSRAARLKRVYGITAEEYDRMLAAQGGVCAICGSVNSNGQRLAVDHDHATGKVRGLLCINCNVGIGYLKDNPTSLRAAADYLESSSQTE